MSSRTHSSLCCSGVDLELPPDRVGDPSLQGAEGFFAGLALGLAAQVVGAPGSVVADLGDGDHVDRVVQLAVASRVEPVTLTVRAGGFDRCGAVVPGELSTRPEPADVVDVAEHDRRDDRADSVEFGQRGSRCSDRCLDADLERVELAVDASHVGKMLTGQTSAFERDRVVADIDGVNDSVP